jgi:hypothetical protein
VTGCALVGVGWLLRANAGELVGGAGVIAYVLGAAAAFDDPALSLVRATGAATAAAVALDPARRQAAAVAAGVAVVAYVVGALMTGNEPDAMSVVLAVGGLTGLAVAARSDRRPAAFVGAGLLLGCLWVRLGAAGVSAP